MNFEAKPKYIAKLLGDEGVEFIIPEYQRPYKWGKDECETLWNDIINAFEENDAEYFLGSVIAFSDKIDQFEIIDGQQRITTFTLLFRAFYEKFKTEIEKRDIPTEIGKCLWEYELDKGFNFEQCRLKSLVATDRESENLENILSENIDTDSLKQNKKSHYVQNYQYFLEKIRDFKENKAMSWEDLCKFMLGKRLFVLFVVCDSQESAMTIFNTLNSRGMPLSNADILKGTLYKYYKNKNEKKLKDFVAQWSAIEKNIENTDNIKDLNLDFLFLQYMHIIRAFNKDYDTTTLKFLDFFTSPGEYKKIGSKKIKVYGASQGWLYKDETMVFIDILADFWLRPRDYLHEKSLCYMSVLNLFQNASWKSFVGCLVWKNKELFNKEKINKEEISRKLEIPLLKLLKAMSLLFINSDSGTNTSDRLVFKLNVNLLCDMDLYHEIETKAFPTFETFRENFSGIETRKSKYLLYLYAYIYNDFSQLIDLSKINLQVEHILPKQWQNANFNGWNEKMHDDYLEEIGNKVLLDKKNNIKCLENFFAKKQAIYKDADKSLKEVLDLGNRKKHNWLKEDIEARNKEIYKRLKDFFEKNL